VRTEDRHIINKCLNGDSTAFGLLVDKYKASVYSLCERLFFALPVFAHRPHLS
jgi:hypothetical protein